MKFHIPDEQLVEVKGIHISVHVSSSVHRTALSPDTIRLSAIKCQFQHPHLLPRGLTLTRRRLQLKHPLRLLVCPLLSNFRLTAL